MPNDALRTIAMLTAANRKLARQNRTLQQQLADVRVSRVEWQTRAEATNLIVGSTSSGFSLPYPDLITEERVAEVELIAKRLRTWLTNKQFRARERVAEHEPRNDNRSQL